MEAQLGVLVVIFGAVCMHLAGPRDNVVEFKYEKVSPRIYKVTVPRLNIGEYGFPAPGAVATAYDTFTTLHYFGAIEFPALSR